MLSRLPITVSAPLLVGVPLLGLGAYLSWMWASESRDAVAELAGQNIAQVNQLAANKIEDLLSTPIELCELNAYLIRSGVLEARDPASWRETFVREARVFPSISAITWGDVEGRCAWVSRYANGSIYWALKADPAGDQMLEWRLDDDGQPAGEPTNAFEFDVHVRPWFVGRIEAGEAGWTDPYLWAGGVDSEDTIGISYGVPLMDADGAAFGVIDADFSLNDLSAFLHSIEIGQTGIAVLTTGDGMVLATSEGPVIAPGGSGVSSAADFDDARLRAVADLLSRVDAGGTLRRVEIDGERHFARIAAAGDDLGLDWRLAILVPRRDFLGDVDDGLLRSTLVSIGAVVLVAAGGLLIARWLVSPLVRVVSAVRRIGQGDFDTSLELRHAPEYRHLAEEVNRMAVGLKDRMRMRESLSLAMEVQKNLLPSEAPTVAGLDIAGHSTYCDETGGDYYDYIEVAGPDSDTIMIALGDVMGHGVAAALLMATARGILRSRCTEDGSLADFLDHVNTLLVPDTGGDRFMTMLLVTINASTREVRWASAGHGQPIIYDPDSDSFLELDGGGVPLGIIMEEEYHEYASSRLKPGSVVLAATDGLWETYNEQHELFGMDRLLAVIRKHAARDSRAISQAIRQSLAEFRGQNDQDDDLTFVIVKVA